MPFSVKDWLNGSHYPTTWGAAAKDVEQRLSAYVDQEDALDRARLASVEGRRIAVGNLGAAYTLDLDSDLNVWLTGTLNANATVTLDNVVAGATALLLLTQDGIGGRTLTLSDGVTSAVVPIADDAGAKTLVRVYSPNGTDLEIEASDGGSTDFSTRLSLVESASEGVLTDTDGTLVGANRPFLNAKTFGVIGDGVANDTAAIRSVVDTGAYVYFPDGRYLFTGTLHDPGDTVSTSKIIGAGPGRAVFLQGADQRLFNRTNSFGPTTSITGSPAAGATSVTVTSVATAGVSEGDYVVLENDNVVGGPKGSVEGEVARIKTIAGDTITFYGQIEFSYLTGDTPLLKRMPLAVGIVLAGFTVENTAPASGKLVSGIIKLAFTLRPRVEDVEFVGLDQTGIELRNCVDGRVRQVRFLDLTNDSGSSLFGYGVLFFEGAVGCSVVGIYMRTGRHAVTTGSGGGLIVPAHCHVNHGIACDMTSAAWDSHEEGRHITFTDVHAWNVPIAFSSRAPHTHYNVGTAQWCDKGWEGSDVAYGSTFKNFELRDMVGTSGTTLACIRMIGEDQAIANVTIDGCMNEGVVTTDNANRARVENVKVTDPGRSGARDICFSIGSGDHQIWRNIDSEDALSGIVTSANADELVLGDHTFNNVTTPYTIDVGTSFKRPPDYHGVGSPEGNIPGPPGSTWSRPAATASPSKYVKRLGSDVTGWEAMSGPRMNTLSTDAGATVTLRVGVSKPAQELAVPITATRTATLSLTDAVEGSEFELTRAVAATGAFNWVVAGLDPASKNLTPGQWMKVRFNGTVWRQVAGGTLL